MLTEKTGIQATMALPPLLDITAAGPLAGEILGHRGKDLAVNAAQVQRMGAQCLQVLLSAAATWLQDGMEFEVTEASPEFTEALETAGLGMNHLSARNS
ncbi:STAS domain-containing protein [Mesorhizobium sp. L-8-10]|uniref:STAS domain-containing protein n=1 Tax=Mesorhizobium sp. L-8-10 TaxID=2744523 RepID=UPI0019282391|nr:STAS domain-containing protein [Mesorhizobium sp. L-8-10]